MLDMIDIGQNFIPLRFYMSAEYALAFLALWFSCARNHGGGIPSYLILWILQSEKKCSIMYKCYSLT